MAAPAEVKEQVKQKYGSAARAVAESGSVQACCDPGLRCCDPITTNLYSDGEKGLIPEKAVLASLGCGNPTALIELKPGETVLDLGSGGGIDVLLSAQRVGPTGKAYGLDMTDEMLALARENQRKAGVENVEFLKGEIENIPLPDNSVDVVISNCVINLSADKDRVLREAFRVLKPGGRFAVSDVVVRGAVPDAVRQSMMLWVGCIAGALEEQDYRAKLVDAGFADVTIEPTRIYNVEDARQFLTEAGVDVDAIAPAGRGQVPQRLHPRRQAQTSCCAAPRACLHQPGAASAVRCAYGQAIMSHHAQPLQRPLSLHRQLGPLHHGRGDSQPQRQGRFHRLQRRQPSRRARRGPRRSQQIASAGHVNRRPAQQILGRVRRSRRAQDGLRLHRLRQRRQRACPYWPGQPMTAHWGIPDPAAVKGTPEEIARAFRDAFVILDRRIGLFLSLPLATLEQLAIQREIDSIGRS